jgi:nitroimidazol reductase NimA-like FMN-containing flavoprotein (pyridoxamine 5'-phosphate oxidase superfamily)
MKPTVELPNMAEYGVEASTWNGLPWAWALERLAANRNFWVTTVSAAGKPHSMPVWGVWDPESNEFGFSCAPTAKKLKNISANPYACIAIDNTVECVSVQGKISILTNQDPGREVWIALLVEKYGAETSADLASFMQSNSVVRFVPIVAFGIIEREEEFGPRATRWRFA